MHKENAIKHHIAIERTRDWNDLPIPESIDVVAFCQLRWDFVWQRPNHLMSRFANSRRVFFVEEPVFDSMEDVIEVRKTAEGVHVVVPHLQKDDCLPERMRLLIERLFTENNIQTYLLWYWTPMALIYSRHLSPVLTIYDCMDELASFAGAPKELRELDMALLSRADVVFTGGHSIYEAKKYLHPNIHPFPSSIDGFHFKQARDLFQVPADQQQIATPQLGFYGVIDERFDYELIREVAEKKPEWQFILIGPIVKVNPASLPHAANMHYLGKKSYTELPAYLAGWDVAILPFARNESTRFISPTKTPEYLAAGKPVVATSIRDVVRPYGEMNLVWIADSPDEFIAAVENAMQQKEDRSWLERVDTFLNQMSWDDTKDAMERVIARTLNKRLLPQKTKSLTESLLQEESNV